MAGRLAPMSEQTSEGEIVWARQFDDAASKRRWKAFRRWALLPLAVVLVVAFMLGGVGAFLGVSILAGGLVGMVAVLFWLIDVNLKQNPEIRLVDGRLVQGRRAVTVADIERWTTRRSTSVRRNLDSSPETQVIFRVPVFHDGVRGERADGGPAFETSSFAWGQMSTEELDGVRDALEPHIDAPWVPPGDLRT